MSECISDFWYPRVKAATDKSLPDVLPVRPDLTRMPRQFGHTAHQMTPSDDSSRHMRSCLHVFVRTTHPRVQRAINWITYRCPTCLFSRNRMSVQYPAPLAIITMPASDIMRGRRCFCASDIHVSLLCMTIICNSCPHIDKPPACVVVSHRARRQCAPHT